MTTVDQVKQKLDIVEVVSRYVPLQKSGRNHRALCPFHQERTPSFYVFPQTQTWRCFGACATGGDVFAFVQRKEGLEFPEALRRLAQEAGVALPQRAGPSPHLRLYSANLEAARFYQERLLSPEGEGAHRYLEGRGVSLEAIQAFLLGYSPADPYALKRHLKGLGYTEEELEAAGLIRGDGREKHDQFRNRIMYPIRDLEGRVTGFGARQLDATPPKYLNTPRTPVFDKGGTLYGLNQAIEAIRRQGVGVIVEGYMDAIAAHQRGFTNVVASMGTALTREQMASLRRFAAVFVLALDPDAAGQAATLQRLEEAARSFQEVRRATGARSARAGDIFAQPAQQFSLRVALLPQGRDPDQVVRQDPQEWERLVSGAVPLLEYLLNVMVTQYDLTSPEGKAQAAERLVPLVYSHVENFVEQDRYFQRVADLLGVSRQVLEASIGAVRGQSRRPADTPQRRTAVSPFTLAQGDPLEEYALALLLQHPELRAVASGVSPDLFARPDNRELCKRWAECATIEELERDLDPLLASHLTTLLTKPLHFLEIPEREQAVRQVFRRLQERRLREVKLQESQALAGEEGVEEGWEEQTLKTNEELLRLFRQQRRS